MRARSLMLILYVVEDEIEMVALCQCVSSLAVTKGFLQRSRGFASTSDDTCRVPSHSHCIERRTLSSRYTDKDHGTFFQSPKDLFFDDHEHDDAQVLPLGQERHQQDWREPTAGRWDHQGRSNGRTGHESATYRYGRSRNLRM